MRIIIIMSDIVLMNMRYFLSPPLYFRPKKGFLQRVFRYSVVALSFPATYVPFFFIPAFPKEKAAEKARRYFIKVYSLSFLRIICLLLLFS
mgnify:FL=1